MNKFIFLIIFFACIKYYKYTNSEDYKTFKLEKNLQDGVKFLTLTNDGYLDYTLNCLKSLKLISSKIVLSVYCIGHKSFNVLRDRGYDCYLLDDNVNTNFQQYRNGNWSNITSKKFDIIYQNLLTSKYVLFTDGDIVYENNKFIDYLIDNIEDNELLIQSDSETGKEYALCSGFMFIKSTVNTRKIFNPKEINKYRDVLGWDDQVYINDIRDKLKYKKLPLDLFPNGIWYYKYNKKINPYLIHFNWVLGHEKKTKMKRYNKWFITCSLEKWQNTVKPLNNLIINSSTTNGKDEWVEWPIGMQWEYCRIPDEQKKINQIGNHEHLLLCCFNTSTDKNRRGLSEINREKIMDNLRKNGYQQKILDSNTYYNELRKYKFIASPEGNGIDCHRHYEALLSGCIPICEYNPKTEIKYSELPILYTKDYSEITDSYLESKYNEIIKKEYNFEKLFLYYYNSHNEKIKKNGNHWVNILGKGNLKLPY